MQAKSALMIAAFVGLLLLYAGQTLAWAQAASDPAVMADTGSTPPADAAQPVDPQLGQVESDNRLAQAEMLDLRRRLYAAEATGRWLPWLMLAVVAMVAMSAWLGLRVRRLQHEKSRRDRAVSHSELQSSRSMDGVASGSAPLLSPDQPLLSGAVPAGAAAALSGAAGQFGAMASSTPSAPTAPPADADRSQSPAKPLYEPLRPAPGAAARSSLLGGSGGADIDSNRLQNTVTLRTGVPPRAVSVEELLDLEQQVDFFMVLGQEQAAIDLLLGHVRATGGINALPYFKLLEIYRQQGDEEAFERTRERFNQRFNATAPDWSGDLAAGRHLTDYPDVIARLQRAWSQPARAMAQLDGMLLRRADLEPFDLPAFHDILTLQALVRDLPPGTVAAPGQVSDGAAWGSASVAVEVDVAVAQGRSLLSADRQAASVDPTVTLASYAGLGAPLDADRIPPQSGASHVDLLLPLDAEATDVTEPRPRMAEPGAARAMLADWMLARSTMQAVDLLADTNPGRVADGARKTPKLDLDLSDFAPAPREFTRPAAFTELDRRLDSRLSDFSAFDDSDLLPPASSRR